MAILPSLPGLEVTVRANDQPFVEHADDNLEETLGPDAALLRLKTVSKYIEVTDEEFTVNISLGKLYKITSPSLLFCVSVDGHSARGEVVHTTPHSMRNTRTRCVEGLSSYDPLTKLGMMHHFKFANIKTRTDDDEESNINREAKRISKVGKIEVKAFRTSKTKKVLRKARKSTIGRSSHEVHEKAMKGQAKSHGVIAGKTTLDTSSTSVRSECLDAPDAPIAYFIFQYRSKEALKQLRIIERTPEPDAIAAPLKQEFPQGGAGRVKREMADDEDVKIGNKRKRPKYKMTIDLTADSDSDNHSVINLE